MRDLSRLQFVFELKGIWVRALPGPMHLGLKTDPLCPKYCTNLEEPCSFSKVPDGPYTKFRDILRAQKEGAQICITWWGQGLTLTQNVDWGFLLSTAFPTGWVITQPHYIYRCLLKVLCPVRRPIITLDCVLLNDNNRATCSQVMARDQFSSLSLCTTRVTPQYQMLFFNQNLSLGFLHTHTHTHKHKVSYIKCRVLNIREFIATYWS